MVYYFNLTAFLYMCVTRFGLVIKLGHVKAGTCSTQVNVAN